MLLFSQFKLMLDVMEVFLQLNGHTYLRLDGSTKSDQRFEKLCQMLQTFTYIAICNTLSVVQASTYRPVQLVRGYLHISLVNQSW